MLVLALAFPAKSTRCSLTSCIRIFFPECLDCSQLLKDFLYELDIMIMSEVVHVHVHPLYIRYLSECKRDYSKIVVKLSEYLKTLLVLNTYIYMSFPEIVVSKYLDSTTDLRVLVTVKGSGRLVGNILL